MALNWMDITVFFVFYAIIIGVSLYKSRHEANSEDYFLAGRGLTWWLIGISADKLHARGPMGLGDLPATNTLSRHRSGEKIGLG